MARRRTRLYVSAGATHHTPSMSLTSLPWPKISVSAAYSPPDYRIIEDRRTYHPEGAVRPARMLSGHPHTPVVVKRAPGRFKPLFPWHKQRFAIPEKTVLCIRRAKRREVMFAKRKAGKRGQKKPRYNWYSTISCRR